MAGGHSLVGYPFVAYTEPCNSHSFDRVCNLLRKREQLAINGSTSGWQRQRQQQRSYVVCTLFNECKVQISTSCDKGINTVGGTER